MSKEDTSFLVDTFFNYLNVERSLSDNTLAAYSRDINKFIDFIEKSGARALSSIPEAHACPRDTGQDR